MASDRRQDLEPLLTTPCPFSMALLPDSFVPHLPTRTGRCPRSLLFTATLCVGDHIGSQHTSKDVLMCHAWSTEQVQGSQGYTRVCTVGKCLLHVCECTRVTHTYTPVEEPGRARHRCPGADSENHSHGPPWCTAAQMCTQTCPVVRMASSLSFLFLHCWFCF